MLTFLLLEWEETRRLDAVSEKQQTWRRLVFLYYVASLYSFLYYIIYFSIFSILYTTESILHKYVARCANGMAFVVFRISHLHS